jgi:predicted phosphate transport protein (TIGR00153 family)
MAFSLIPKEEKFFELFEAQAAHNAAAAKVFREMATKWSRDTAAFDRLRDIEHEADMTCHEIYDKLNRTFVTPFDREDIRDLASELDTVVDLIESVAQRMYLYQIDHSTDDLVRLTDILWQCTETVRKAIAELQTPAKSRRVMDYCIEVNRLENAGDQALGAAIGKLFTGKPDPLEVMKWKEIYETVEEAIDKCEDIAHTLETILVKQA